MRKLGWTDGFAEGEIAAAVVKNWGISWCGSADAAGAPFNQRETLMSPLRLRMIEDMKLAGLGWRTQAAYIAGVRRLAAHYRRSPDALSEDEVRSYLIGLRDRGVARGTFNTHHYGIQFLYRHTLDRDWSLFFKKPHRKVVWVIFNQF